MHRCAGGSARIAGLQCTELKQPSVSIPVNVGEYLAQHR